MHRVLFLAAVLIEASSVAMTHADAPTTVSAVLGLEDRLTTGLRVRQPEDAAFIKEVARLVRSGELPAKLVDSTYLWALNRQRKYPFPVFARALRIQADRLGVEL